MQKIVTIVALICAIAFQVNAQENRNQTYNITLGNVQYAHHDEKMSAGEAIGKVLTGLATGQVSVQATKYEGDVKNAIIKGLSGAYRFHYNDGLQTGELAEEGNIVADAIITNIQAKSNTQTWKDTKGKIQTSTYYTGIAEAMLTLKDAKTGEVITNTSFKGQGTTVSSFSTSDQAIRDALGKLSNRISAWLNKYKPLQANIIEGSSAKKDKQKEVYIDLGNSEGAFAGLHMGVFIVKTVAGREAKSQIGKLKIEAVEGDEISLCKVQSGGKDIKAAIEAGQQLQVISIDK
jgi:hypothetical protein